MHGANDLLLLSLLNLGLERRTFAAFAFLILFYFLLFSLLSFTEFTVICFRNEYMIVTNRHRHTNTQMCAAHYPKTDEIVFVPFFVVNEIDFWSIVTIKIVCAHCWLYWVGRRSTIDWFSFYQFFSWNEIQVEGKKTTKIHANNTFWFSLFVCLAWEPLAS